MYVFFYICVDIEIVYVFELILVYYFVGDNYLNYMV